VETLPGFRFRAITVAAGVERVYNPGEWRDTLVVVGRGVLELRSLDGDSYRFAAGCVLSLDGLPLRALRSPGPEPAVLLAVSRSDEFSFRDPSKQGRRGSMTEHAVVTREEWVAARKELREEEEKHAARSEELANRRRELPWVRVDKEYTLDTEEGPRTLAELFDGRSQLLAYNIMFGPSYEGACPGCSNLADHLSDAVVHLNHRDVTLIAFSRAPIEKLKAYRERMGWTFPWVSTHGSDFAFDFELALTKEQLAGIDEVQESLKDPPDWLQDWARQVGTDLESGMSENPSWIAFALEDGVVYQTSFRPAPDRDFVVPYSSLLLDQTPKGRSDDFRAYRKDEYPDS
jgi:predicted dithiol-disulfide oxidoreductase (DUF899 family)